LQVDATHPLENTTDNPRDPIILNRQGRKTICRY
jgi:hypothetical protein